MESIHQINDLADHADKDMHNRLKKAKKTFNSFLQSEVTNLLAARMLQFYREFPTSYYGVFQQVSRNLNTLEGLEGACVFIGCIYDDADYIIDSYGNRDSIRSKFVGFPKSDDCETALPEDIVALMDAITITEYESNRRRERLRGRF